MPRLVGDRRSTSRTKRIDGSAGAVGRGSSRRASVMDASRRSSTKQTPPLSGVFRHDLHHSTGAKSPGMNIPGAVPAFWQPVVFISIESMLASPLTVFATNINASRLGLP